MTTMLFNVYANAQVPNPAMSGPPARELTLTSEQKEYYKEFIDRDKYTIYDIILSAEEWKRYVDSGFDSSVLTQEFSSGKGKPIRLNTWVIQIKPIQVYEEDLTEPEVKLYRAAIEYMAGCWDVKFYLPQRQTVLMQSLLIPVTSANKVTRGSIKTRYIAQSTSINSMLVKTDNSPWLVPMELTINTEEGLLGQGFVCYNFDTQGKITTPTTINAGMRGSPTLPVFQQGSLLTIQVDPNSKSDFLFTGANMHRATDVQA